MTPFPSRSLLRTRTLPAERPTAAGARGFSALQLYGALFGSIVASALLMARAGLTIEPASRSNDPYYLAILAALTIRAGSLRMTWRHARALGDCAEYYCLFMVVGLIGAVTSYPISALTHGFADPVLQRIDEGLHFDWLAWYRAVAAHPALQRLGIAAYESIYWTPAILLGWFALTGQRREAHRFLGGFWLAAVMTLALFALMPAVGPFSYLWHGPIPYMPVSELWQPDLIPALRAHHVQVVDLGQLRGLVSAPSFHAASATLYIATAWRVRPLRWPLTWVNVAMLVSTPVEGTHYLSDMIVGALVALVAILVVNRLLAPGELATA